MRLFAYFFRPILFSVVSELGGGSGGSFRNRKRLNLVFPFLVAFLRVRLRKRVVVESDHSTTDEDI